MKKLYESMNLLEFQSRFRTEEDCEKHLFNLRWPTGFVCPMCHHNEYYYLRKRKLFQCKECKHQASVTAGTVMHKTRTPLVKWFWAIYLIASDKRGISALALTKQLDISQYVAWTMEHKIRRGMKDRDADYKLAGLIEIDDSFFGGPDRGGKRGRGSKKATVVIEVATYGDSMTYARMRKVKSVSKKEIKRIVKKDVKEKQVFKTDGFKAYGVLEEIGHEHQVEVVKGKKAHLVLKWVHILASNVKAYLKGTLHGKYKKKHLQKYLDEFCYRLNRRRWSDEMFDRLATACACSTGITYAELTQ